MICAGEGSGREKKQAWIVAVTGRSGTGKSTVSAHLVEKGYTVLDADRVAREITLPGSPCLAPLAQRFGADIIMPDGTLNRRLLAARAFETPDGAHALADITHPEIIARLLADADKAMQQGARLVFVDGAVIVGGLFEQHCDKIIVVTAPVKDSISRIVLRDGISKEAARERLAAQMPEEALCAAADYILTNRGARQTLLRQADAVLAELEQLVQHI